MDIDKLYEWVMENKFDELSDWCDGEKAFCEDTYEDCLDAYIEENLAVLTKEYLDTLKCAYED